MRVFMVSGLNNSFSFSEYLSDKHLIVYLDINGTIVGYDSGAGRSGLVENYCKTMLAEGFRAEWEKGRPQETYKEYIRGKITGKDAFEVRKKRKEVCGNMVDDLAKRNHPYALQAQEKLDQLKAAAAASSVFESFPKLLDFLSEQKVSHTIVLRTMGIDGGKVQRYLNKNYPQMKFRPGIMNGAGEFEYLDAKGMLCKCKTLEEFHALMENSKGVHWSIKDNWSRWNQNGQLSLYGKPFPYNPASMKSISIFADDNVGQAAHPKEWSVLAPYDLQKKKFVGTNAARDHIIGVTAMDAALNPQYYVEQISDRIERIAASSFASREAA